MATIKFTPQQSRAIDHSGSALLVSAAAGSGKTAVLVERAVRILCREEDPVDADRLLIVTFTRAAAASLRAKLAQRLSAELAKRPGSGHLRRQRMLLQRAPICTIDSYCLQLLKTHFSALDIPADFTTADGPQLAQLRRQALADALENAYNDPDFCAFADLYGKGRSDAMASRVVEQLHDFLSSMPRPEKVLEAFCAQWEEDAPLDETRWGQTLRTEARRAALCARELAAQNLEDLENDPAIDEAYRPALESDEAAVDALLDAIDAQPWNAMCEASRALSYARLKAVRGHSSETMTRIKERRDLLKDTLKRLQETIFLCSEEEFLQDRRTAAPLVRALVRAEREFNQRFYQAKLEEKMLEFSDVEQLALQLLQNEDGTPTPLAAQLSEEFYQVMVDEYQDTNALQDTLYHCLAKPDGSNLFFVGDLKQSIYRFRQADPTIFQQKLDRFVEYGQPGPQKLFLDANFRSAPGVIGGVNAIFTPLMSRKLGGVDYGPGERLVPGLGELENYGGYAGDCEFRLVQSERPAGDAEYIARRIRQLMDPASGFTVRGETGPRPPRYEDFCILLRSRGVFADYAARLESEGIPVYVDRAENLLDAPEIRPVASLLRVLDNPAQDVHLAAVMLSGMGGFTPDDLVALRLGRKNGSFYGAVMASEDEKVKAFGQWLRTLRQLSQTMPVDRLMEEIFARTGCLAAAGAMPDGSARRENLRQFAAFAAGCGGHGLAGVVRAMDAALAGEGVPGPEQGQSRPGCVTIMTVHRSKGLEFPVVFAADLGREFNKEDLRAAAVFHPQLGIGLTLRAGQGGTYVTAPYRAVQSALAQEGLSEEMRVLYVAFTRARDKLVMTMPTKNALKLAQKMALRIFSGAPEPYLLEHCGSRGEWVMQAVMAHPQAQSFCRQLEVEVMPQPLASERELADRFTVSLEADEVSEPASACPVHLPEAAPDEALARALREHFAWQYPNEALTRVPAKVSVTALTHEAAEPTLERPGFLYKEGLTAAEKGTALHAFLQHADLAAAAADPEGEARRQVKAKLLDESLYEKMDFSRLRQFFAGSLFARMRSAQKILREYEFITARPAADAAVDKTGDYGQAQVLVQGVADVILEFDDHLELVDYKTDRNKTPDQFIAAYRPQLLLYAAAIRRRFEKPLTKLTLYSFSLGREIDVQP
ncbi:helicase-exonuclease AddAB subunit AddA [Allofournierella massiliensis]|uniref:DNA 3'-5' helicase n=1 Tax=Allofournierella massiliensis TaxID=1650663 RepID=A0A4R1QUQ8_9FIRM|nr:helicase-exonuclease AddAB subunit AddA [Fournierella massiliensis]TCL54674.1 DNA helicase/exodeoxyribonuclease V subunit A [Fournierella massiliensis]